MSKFVAKTLGTTLLLLILVDVAHAQSIFSGAAEIEEALEKSQVLGSALFIAAHPDDENTAVLAWLARGRHMRTGYLSLTRGEGGQNLIGSEQGDALGVIRTQELLAARRVDGAEQFFTRAVDFGFSKDPKEAIAKWGHDEVLSDIVWVIRRFQPDVIILRFSGKSEDGHGHHQASAILGKEAFAAAADPKRFPEQLQWVQPWQAKRLVWNAFSFTPEQEAKLKKTPERVEADTGAFDPIAGRSFGEIAGISRSQHRSQGMGARQDRGPSTNYFLPVSGEAPVHDLFDGVVTTWSRVEDGAAIGELLANVQKKFSPQHPELAIPGLVAAHRRLAPIAKNGAGWATEKLAEIDHLLQLCSGLWVDAASDRSGVSPGDSVKVTLTAIRRLSAPVTWNGFVLHGPLKADRQTMDAAMQDSQPVSKEIQVEVPSSAAYSQPFWLAEPPHGDRYSLANQHLVGQAAPVPALTASFEMEISGVPLRIDVPVQFRYIDRVRGELTRPLTVVPAMAVNLPERAVIFPEGEARRITVQIKANTGAVSGSVRLEAPAGWNVLSGPGSFKLDTAGAQQDVSFDVKPAAGTAGARSEFRAVASAGGREVSTGMQAIDYEHIPPQVIFRASVGRLQPEKLRVLATNIGYIMGAGDAVPEAIRQMGANVTLLDENDLSRGDLSRFDAIVTGVRAYNVRQDLKAAQPRVLEYVRNGGTLVVQYNVLEFVRFGGKPNQPGPLAPFPLEISGDRVVDEDSPITLVEPACPLLSQPNAIGPADFEGWVQERGLYFANKWDSRYSTVLATHDPGGKDLPGGMLYAKYGKGVYVFTAYSWFRELPAGVPGAYRIFANLLSAGKTLAVTASKP